MQDITIDQTIKLAKQIVGKTEEQAHGILDPFFSLSEKSAIIRQHSGKITDNGVTCMIVKPNASSEIFPGDYLPIVRTMIDERDLSNRIAEIDFIRQR